MNMYKKMRNWNLLFVAVVALLVGVFAIGCTQVTVDAIEEEFKKLTIGDTLDHGFEDYVSTSGVKVKFTSDNHDILDGDGFFHVPLVDTEFVLTVTMEQGGKIETKDYDLTALATPVRRIREAIDLIKSRIPEKTTSNLRLEDYNYAGVLVTFESLDPDVISKTGQISQMIGEQTGQVLITYSFERTIYTNVRTITIAGYTDITLVSYVVSWLPSVISQLLEGEIENLPDTHPSYKTKITWLSNCPGFVSLNGTVNIPVEVVNISLQAEVSQGTIKQTINYDLEAVGGNTEEAFLQKWIETLVPSKVIGSVNHIYQQYITGGDTSYYLEYQEYVNVGGPLNLIDGKTLEIDKSYYINTNDQLKNRLFYSGTPSAIPQSSLNDLFYTGYTMPNPQNILWIVVHESGMPLEGQDANLLARTQYNNAYTAESPREASWHYSVDAYKVYQSFDDLVRCWHAGGSTTILPYGNSNSIGIEMCINTDGNYEGSMRNDAKLVAMLMHRYNLAMDNIKRHYDFSGKECPSYMIRTNRWTEFLALVAQEYLAIRYLKDATVTWTVETELLDTYFAKGGNNLYYNLEVTSQVDIPLSLSVVRNGKTYNASNTLVLNPKE